MSLTIESIHHTPLTGGRHLERNYADFLPGGAAYNRWYVPYDSEDGKRRGVKEFSRLATMQTGIQTSGELALVVDPESNDHLVLPTDPSEHSPVLVSEFGDQVPCHDMGDRAADFLRDITGSKTLRLAHKNIGWALGRVGVSPEERHQAPVHIVTDASLQWLKENTPPGEEGQAPPDVRRVRADFVVSGASEPHEELGWVNNILIVDGRIAFKITRGTPRCRATGYDPDTGKNRKDVPKTFRKMPHNEKGKALFGVYAVPLVPVNELSNPRLHRIALNSKVEVLDV